MPLDQRAAMMRPSSGCPIEQGKKCHLKRLSFIQPCEVITQWQSTNYGPFGWTFMDTSSHISYKELHPGYCLQAACCIDKNWYSYEVNEKTEQEKFKQLFLWKQSVQKVLQKDNSLIFCNQELREVTVQKMRIWKNDLSALLS